MRFWAAVFFILALASTPQRERYLVTWGMESKVFPGDEAGHDFLAVFDITDSSDFGALAAMLPVPTRAQMAHHTNPQMPANGMLFANDFMAGASYVFDVRDPRKPTIAASFTNAGPYTHPHSFSSLANGNVLATYQLNGTGDVPGALVELDSKGRMLRASDAADKTVDKNIRPYGVVVLENVDRIVTTSAPMPPLMTKAPTHVAQVWRLSDLKLLKTIGLPSSTTYRSTINEDSDDAAVLADGKTVYVKTSSCGLYRIEGVAGTNPTASLVYDYGYRGCSGVPVVAGKYWVETSMSGHCITSLDVTDPAHPVEAGHVIVDGNARPHWLALEPGTGNLVVTGFGSMLNKIYFAKIDLNTGALSMDPRTIDFNRKWPDGWNGPAIPHGTVFYRRGSTG